MRYNDNDNDNDDDDNNDKSNNNSWRPYWTGLSRSYMYLLPCSFLYDPPYLLRVPSISMISGMKLANIACTAHYIHTSLHALPRLKLTLDILYRISGSRLRRTTVRTSDVGTTDTELTRCVASYGKLGHVPASTSNNFIFSSLWSKSDSQRTAEL